MMIMHSKYINWSLLTFWIQHTRDIQVLLRDIKGGIQILERIILQDKPFLSYPLIFQRSYK